MKRHWQFLIGGLSIIAAFALGVGIYVTQRPTATIKVNKPMVAKHYRVWKGTYLQGDSNAKFVVTNQDHDKKQTLSEAQGYGMLIAIMAARQGFGSQKTFDQLTQYYVDHQISKDNPLMAWRQQQVGKRMVSTTAEKTSATDGDLDIAYALILADEYWAQHGKPGRHDYGKLARRLLKAIAAREINPVTKLPRVGDWAKEGQSSELVRSSDLITAYFRKFARYTRDGTWTQVVQNSQTVLQKLSGKYETGLMADFVTVQGRNLDVGSVLPKQVDSPYDHQYGFNACRVPWRVAYDYQLNHSRISYDVTAKMLKFFRHCQRPGTVHDLSGNLLAQYDSAAFTAPVAYAAYVLNDQKLSQRYAPELDMSLVKQGYYPATLHMVTLLTSGTLGDAD